MSNPIQSVTIDIIHPDGNTSTFYFEAPNDPEAPFEFGFREVSHGGKYRDGNNVLRKSYSFYRFFARFSYHSHTMDVRWLLTARNIQLRFPPNFESGTYQSADVILVNDEAVRSFLAGLAVGDDMLYNDNVVLEFEGVRKYEWNQIFEIGINEIPGMLKWNDANILWNDAEIIWNNAR